MFFSRGRFGNFYFHFLLGRVYAPRNAVKFQTSLIFTKTIFLELFFYRMLGTLSYRFSFPAVKIISKSRFPGSKRSSKKTCPTKCKFLNVCQFWYFEFLNSSLLSRGDVRRTIYLRIALELRTCKKLINEKILWDRWKMPHKMQHLNLK